MRGQGEQKVLTSGAYSEDSVPARVVARRKEDRSARRLIQGVEWPSLVAIDATVLGKRKGFLQLATKRIFDNLAWLPDGSGVLVLEREQSTNFNRSQIGFVSYPKGVYTPVTRDTNSYSDLSVDSSGHLLAMVLSEYRWNLQVMPAGARADQVKQVASSDADTNFTWTAENQLISDQTNTLNLIDPATGSKTSITRGVIGGGPSACADGRSVVFGRFQNGSQNIWRWDADSNLKQLSNGKLDVNPCALTTGSGCFSWSRAANRNWPRCRSKAVSLK